MAQQRLLFDTSPVFLLLFLILSIGAAWLLYQNDHSWGRRVNLLLAFIRGSAIFLLLVLLLGPFVRQVRNIYEKPVFVILQDNSLSVKSGVDSAKRTALNQSITALGSQLENDGYESYRMTLDGETDGPVTYQEKNSDLNQALHKVATRFEGKEIGGVLLASDGIYNSGVSPLYSTFNFPIYTLGIGDSVARPDIAIRNLNYNRIAYQGNRFPLQAEVSTVGFSGHPITLTVEQQGKIVARMTKTPGSDPFLVFDFLLDADKAGLERINVSAERIPQEYHTDNNSATAFVEVVEGKKKILVVAPAPNPDIKALKAVIDKNQNYSFLLEIPGVRELNQEQLKPENLDLVVLYQSPDGMGKTTALFDQYLQSHLPLLFVLGRQSNFVQLQRAQVPISLEVTPGQYDQVTPIVNSVFSHFNLKPEDEDIFSVFPPVSVPFGKMRLSLSAAPLLFQRIGSVSTDKPLLAVDTWNDRRIGIMLGEGFWQWRLNEFLHNENSDAFDEVFGKLLQYLSTQDEQSKFKCYPLQREFSDSEPVVFEAQIYNDVYEPVYGNTIHIEIQNEAGKKQQFEYVTSPVAPRYEMNAMPEGVYTYVAKTDINGKPSQVHGEFLVVASQLEMQNLTADFGLLRRLSAQTGGHFYHPGQLNELTTALDKSKAISTLHSETYFDSLINLKWLFWILLIWIAAEWFLRKYLGAY